MASILLDRVSVEFTLYQGSSRSLKTALLHASTSGAIKHDARHRVVVRALDEVSLRLEEGDRLGLIGGNGAGKTTLLRVLAGVYEALRGRVRIEGRVTPLFDVGFGLDWDATGYENIRVRAAYLGIHGRKVEERMEDIAAFTELGEYLALPMRTYSAGMKLRLAFAIATAFDTEILIMDEWIGVSDARFLEKAQDRARAFVERSRIFVIASHMEPILTGLCNKLLWMERGRVVLCGPTEEVLARYHERLAAADAADAAVGG